MASQLSKKRAAEPSIEAQERPAKRGKSRKYHQRPAWARLAKTNPKYRPGINGDTAASEESPQMPPPRQRDRLSNGPNVHPMPGRYHPDQPWLDNPPLDWDIIHARQIFGNWEKSIKWNTAYPDLDREVTDWLSFHLSNFNGIGYDPTQGAIEIEAKLGHLIDRGTNERIQFPVRNMTVLEQMWFESDRFECRLTESQHAFEAGNAFLNQMTRESHTEGRVPLEYSHPRSQDVFHPLSARGRELLPAAFRNLNLHGRDLNLRTTTDVKTGIVTARIVKINLAHMHIYSPHSNYDARISINLEVDLNRPELEPFTDLVEAPSAERPAQPARNKDRCSYKHLAYQIDLTRVDVANTTPKYELEVEVEAAVLREQIRMRTFRGYNAVISGFLENIVHLMRLRGVDGTST
ncbi:mRNA triphosphatase CET1 [Piedraia hortae CBS 480.64]|uniref:mRNA-capping enzyme subunit beta n=1 Tax=Piedraia hortae CBS 480.64 TaxID=1314780 RepID=A0A6A7BUT8_9PEZI|nr:mRNA triphosphatase CET1 [Piedraia hortae CBS 480.64]